MAGTTRPGLAARVSVGRALASDRIILDATSWERPAVSVRVEMTPLELDMHIEACIALRDDEERNARAYAYEIATNGYEEVMP